MPQLEASVNTGKHVMEVRGADEDEEDRFSLLGSSGTPLAVIKRELHQLHQHLSSTVTLGVDAPNEHVQLISSGSEEVISVRSGSGFAGFSSPGQTQKKSPKGKKLNLKRRSDGSCGDNSDVKNWKMSAKNVATATISPGDADDNDAADMMIPQKRKKPQNFDENFSKDSTISKSPPVDQIVEINSNSTTISEKQKRLKLHNKLHRNLNVNQRQQTNNVNTINKCSTESTSEFPVSSPSNPHAGGSKFPQRSLLLKNTLPADSFERHMAMISACNPQMTLTDKIRSWHCDTELSDVEDVNQFDDLFREHEETKRKSLRGRKQHLKEAVQIMTNPPNLESVTETDNYDFQHFLKLMQKALSKPIATKQQIRAKYYPNTLLFDKDKPSTSAAAHLAVQRRLKAAAADETRKRLQQKDLQTNKTAENSTTPPATSSSENDVECYPSPKNKSSLKQKGPPQRVLVYEKVLCPSSSEETSQEAAMQHNLQRSNSVQQRRIDGAALSKFSKTNTSTIAVVPAVAAADAATTTQESPPLNLHWTSTDTDSVFRLHRLNREIDKREAHSSKGLIQMRFDYIKENEDNMNTQKEDEMGDIAEDVEEIGVEERNELFKTPIVPQKYLSHQEKSAIINAPNTEDANVSPTHSNEGIELASETATTTVSTAIGSQQHFSNSPIDAGGEIQLGAFHQQHEFCNYLGLTGMSTANAVANAVAELAKCNLTRRSLRVRRLQQQEKREKSTKDYKRSVATNSKIKNHHSHHDRHYRAEIMLHRHIKEERATNCILGDDSEIEKNAQNEKKDQIDQEENQSAFRATSQTPSAKEQLGQCDTSLELTQSPVHSYKMITKEPEIKILCHIATNSGDDGDVENKTKTTTSPPTPLLQRKTLIQHRNPDHAAVASTTASTSNYTSTLPSTSHSEMADGEDTRSNPTTKEPKHQIISPITAISRSSSNIKEQPISSIRRCTENNHRFESGHQAEMHTKVLHKQIQKNLELSRQTKPSIFIVKALDSTNSENVNDAIPAASTRTKSKSLTNIKHRMRITPSPSADSSKKLKRSANKTSNNLKSMNDDKLQKSSNRQTNQIKIRRRGRKSSRLRLHKLLTRSVLNMNQQRQLRNRKIVIVKTIHKRKQPKTKEKSTQKTTTSDVTLKPIHEMDRNQKDKEEEEEDVKQQKGDMKASLKSHVSLIPVPIKERRKSRATSIANDTAATTNNTSTTTTTGTTTATTAAPVHLDNETVVVSSTTNTYEEANPVEVLEEGDGGELAITKDVNCKKLSASPCCMMIASSNETKDSSTQCQQEGICFLLTDVDAQHSDATRLRNPIKYEHGCVHYIYYEMDVLIVVQEHLISFWKYSKLLNALVGPSTATRQQHPHDHHNMDSLCMATTTNDIITCIVANAPNEWIHLGECKHLINDIEISTPYINRICIHNSMPVYVEMRCREVPRERRDCHLLSMYINVYYYHDEEMHAKMHSIQLDAVQSVPTNVIYTTITESRYFVMCWPQENILGKIRTGLCKYSLTPHLDTLASIREFKSMRHEISYLECTDDDKLLGFGRKQLTIWDHRSGDVLMNYDLDINLGRNLGSIYYPSLEIGQNNMILLFQYVQNIDDSQKSSEIMVLACNISHSAPTYRLLRRHQLPQPAFNAIEQSVNTSEHIVITTKSDEEIWISCTSDSNVLTYVPAQHTQRFYARGRAQLIEIKDDTLTVDTLTNHVLKMAANAAATNRLL